MIALVLLAIGVLAAVKSLAAMNRMIAAGALTTRVAVTAATKIESLLAGGCGAAPESGDSAFGGVRLRWDRQNGEQRVVAHYPLDGVERSDTVTLSPVCSL